MENLLADTEHGKWRGPYFLLSPLDWIQEKLGNAIASDPSLIVPLLEINQARMHLVALALAHQTNDVPLDLVRKLLTEPMRKVLDLCLEHRPAGLERALHHLPRTALSPNAYRNLVDLLRDSGAAKFVQHLSSIDETTITGMQNLPTILRTPAIISMFGRVEGMARLVEGLQFIALRAHLSFEILTSQIASLRQPAQIAAHIRKLADDLPLPDALPPARVETFRRVDSALEIRDLGKKWQNCLGENIWRIDEGLASIYVSDPRQVTCFVCRHGRLGWFFHQANGPRNRVLEPQSIMDIRTEFARAGIQPPMIIEAIKTIISTRDWSGSRQRPEQSDILAEMEAF